MSTEHEGGFAGSSQPAPDAPADAQPTDVQPAVAQHTDVHSADVHPADAEPTVVQSAVESPAVSSVEAAAAPTVAPPADPELAGFPPPAPAPVVPAAPAAPGYPSAPGAAQPPYGAVPPHPYAQPYPPSYPPQAYPQPYPPQYPHPGYPQGAPGGDPYAAYRAAYPGQPVPGQPAPGQSFPGQPVPGQPAPGWPAPPVGYPATAPQPIASAAPGEGAPVDGAATPADGTPVDGVPGATPGEGGAGDGASVPGAPGGWGSDGLPPQPPYPPVWGQPYPPEGPRPKKKRSRGALVALLVATALVAGGVGGLIGAAIGDDNSSNSTTVSSSANPKALSRPAGSIAAIAQKALPSVVTINASGSQESGTGTGFVFDTQGHILTNNHVVAPSLNGGKLTVTFSDGKTYPASVVGRAEGYDVAVIKLDQTPKETLTPLPLGDSDAVQVGDATIAIGAPFGLSGTVTSGIVSAKNRPVASGDETGDQTSYMNALQTDASINPGNSGGPLMNASGQVIGIDSAIQSTGQTTSGGQSGSIGLGFAIPINQAKWVADQLIKTGQPVYPIIGVLRDDSYQGNGAKIASGPVDGTPAVTPGGPADKAGLKAGDVITSLDGTAIDSGPTLVSEIWSHHPGDKITLTYVRGGKTYTTTVVLGSRKGDQ